MKLCLFTTLLASTSTPKPKKLILNSKVKPKSMPKSTVYKTLPINADELEKMEMVKSRPLAENTCCEWYGWFIIHIPESVEKSVSNAKK